jgi:hypothetical protein
MSLKEEYSSLRDEILQFSDRQVNLVTFALTITAALLGYGITSGNGFVSLVPLLMLAFVLIQLVRVRRGMIRISSYLSYFIESRTNDLGWETRVNQLRKLTAKERGLKHPGVSVISFGMLPIVVGFVCIGISFAYLGRRLWPAPAVVALIWLIFSVLTVRELNYVVSDQLWQDLVRNWSIIYARETSGEQLEPGS